MSVLNKVFKSYSDKEIARLKSTVDKIEAMRPAMKEMSDEALTAKTAEFRERLANGETLDDILPEAYAVVREAMWRCHGFEHHRVQLFGGIIMHQGRIGHIRRNGRKSGVYVVVRIFPVRINNVVNIRFFKGFFMYRFL